MNVFQKVLKEDALWSQCTAHKRCELAVKGGRQSGGWDDHLVVETELGYCKFTCLPRKLGLRGRGLVAVVTCSNRAMCHLLILCMKW